MSLTINRMNNLVANIDVDAIEKEIEEKTVIENTKDKEEFKSFLEQTILERCMEIDSKIDNAETWEDAKAANDEWIGFARNCQSFMTREEFDKIADKAYDKIYEEEAKKVINLNSEDITVDIVKDFIDINTNLYWKIINKNDLGIFALCKKGLIHNNSYYMKSKGLKHRVERQVLEETKKMYLDLKRDYEALTKIEKEYNKVAKSDFYS